MLADLFDDICSKRLRVAMDVELLRLYQARALRISATCYENLLRVSPATMDRLRARHRPRHSYRPCLLRPSIILATPGTARAIRPRARIIRCRTAHRPMPGNSPISPSDIPSARNSATTSSHGVPWHPRWDWMLDDRLIIWILLIALPAMGLAPSAVGGCSSRPRRTLPRNAQGASAPVIALAL